MKSGQEPPVQFTRTAPQRSASGDGSPGRHDQQRCPCCKERQGLNPDPLEVDRHHAHADGGQAEQGAQNGAPGIGAEADRRQTKSVEAELSPSLTSLLPRLTGQSSHCSGYAMLHSPPFSSMKIMSACCFRRAIVAPRTLYATGSLVTLSIATSMTAPGTTPKSISRRRCKPRQA